MKKSPKIFVIVVTYKGRRWYDKCFGSLLESEMPVQIVAVDNTPGEEDAEYIKSHFPDVHLIKTNENLGFGRANNLGMRYAMDKGCDYVFLLNQDAWVEKDTLSKLVEITDKHPEYAIISPMHMNAKKDHINVMIDDGNRNYELLSDLYTHNLKDVYTITYVNAAAWLLPRKTMETIGGFCPLIFHYGEDDDYMHRVYYHEYKIGLVPSAIITHDTTERLNESEIYSSRARWDDIDTLLDINNPRTMLSLRKYLLWKRIISWIRHDKSSYEYYFHRYQVVRENHTKIEQCRKAHKIKQANWL